MTDIFYPDELRIPMATEFGLQAVSPLLRTKMVSGRARQRRIYTSVPTECDVRWQFKQDADAQKFETWFRDSLSDGVAWFLMRLRTPMGIGFYKCRFTDIYMGPYLTERKFWQYSARLELWERPMPARPFDTSSSGSLISDALRSNGPAEN